MSHLRLMTLNRIRAQRRALKSHRALAMRRPNKTIIRFSLSRRGIITRRDERRYQRDWSRTFRCIKRGQSAKSRSYTRWKRAKTSIVRLLFTLGVHARWGEDWLNNVGIGDLIQIPLHIIDYFNASATTTTTTMMTSSAFLRTESLSNDVANENYA